MPEERVLSAGDDVRRWLAVSGQRPAGTVQLVCIPYVGGGAWVFRNWQALLGDKVFVCPLHLPGRGPRLREPRHTRMPDLVEAVLEGIGSCLQAPFAIFGHSMGAETAFELARLLRGRLGLEPIHLFVSGCPAPAPFRPSSRPLIHLLPDEAFMREMEDRYGNIPGMVPDEELVRLVLPVLRADMQIHETYRLQPDAPLACPISAFGGDYDRELTPCDLDAWRNHTTGGFEARMFPGGHFYLHEREKALVGRIGRILAG